MIEINQILNNTYRIEEQLGSGGGGIVFKAYHMRLEKYVAVKLIKEEILGAVNERAEADILKRLKHEGLPQVYDFIIDGSDVYTVMEFIDGCSLFDEIVKRGKISYKQSLEWSKQICAAAAYLHTRKPPIIHSDIKPQNIMITSEGKVCLIDFNISSVFGGGIYTVGSSDGYSPPEQYIARADKAAKFKLNKSSNSHRETQLLIDDDATEIIDDKTEIISEMQVDNNKTEDSHTTDNTIIDVRSDVYSIGAVMYSMVTGMKPCNSRKNVTPLKKFDANIPEAFVYIIEKAMSKEKEKRFSSAEEMLKALNNINKLDKRYKRMALRQEIAFIFCVALLVGSIISAISGYRLMQTENANKLNEYISVFNEMNISEDYSEFDNVFSSAASEYPNNAELHYYKALMLYKNQNYDEAQLYINENLLNNISELSNETQSDIYFIYADILFRQENYSEAAEYYKNAVEFNTESADIYRDYAISLARIGDTSNAENIMQTAVNKGLTKDGIFMVTGEIQFMNGEFSEAVDSLKSGIAISDNDTLKRNAYLLCSRAYKEQYSADNENIMLENISLLEGALLALPQEMTMQIREYLAQAYIDYGEISGRDDYFAKAVTLLEEMKPLGWSNYQTEMNIAVLCDRIGRTDNCKRVLLEMAEEPDYEPYYFTIYTRLAYCEADIQGKLEAEQRDYTEFNEFYNSAENAYKIYTENGNSDPEMDKLTQLRDELASLGWIN
ncbi:MAG: protein kinase [Ruminococcus sp.]|nr:protein kinase [Ruminococcus sp.]